MRWSSVCGVRGLASRMCASSGIRSPFGSRSKRGSSNSSRAAERRAAVAGAADHRSPARAGRRGPRTRRACGSCARPGRCRRRSSRLARAAQTSRSISAASPASGLRGAVAEAEQVAARAVALGPRSALVEAVDRPAQRERAAHRAQQLAQRVDDGVAVARVDLQEDVAVRCAPGRGRRRGRAPSPSGRRAAPRRGRSGRRTARRRSAIVTVSASGAIVVPSVPESAGGVVDLADGRTASPGASSRGPGAERLAAPSHERRHGRARSRRARRTSPAPARA